MTARELTQAGIHTQVLSRLVAGGEIERIARGLYRLPERAITEHHGLAIAAAAVPNGIVCLLSALQFHRIGTQLPSEVWMAIDRRARRPALRYPPLRIVRYTGAALRPTRDADLLGCRMKDYFDVPALLPEGEMDAPQLVHLAAFRLAEVVA